MPDVIDVIKGIEEVKHLIKCENLPAHSLKALLIMDDALALLEEQVPRVMTLEEVRDKAEYMFLEKHSETGSDLYGCAIRGDWDGYGIELLMNEYDCARGKWIEYGKTWRCWTSRPTDEQRKAAEWR